MSADLRVLLATSNPHKVQELRELLGDLPMTLVSLGEVGAVPEVEETGATFEANARLKAEAYAEATGLLALADDSGLEIDALGGEPGVYSARWAGVDTSYDERFRLILARLAGAPDERRAARYRAVIAIAGPGNRGVRGVASGTLEGRIALAPRGVGGFGYDPIFFVPEAGRTVGEMTAQEKHRISHRAQAAAGARKLLLAVSQADAGHSDEA